MSKLLVQVERVEDLIGRADNYFGGGRDMSRLYPCVYCTEEGYCKKFSDKEVTSWCIQSPCGDEKPSNADRIRAMTDEELAMFIDDVQKYNIVCRPILCNDCVDCMSDLCWQCWREWLKQEEGEG